MKACVAELKGNIEKVSLDANRLYFYSVMYWNEALILNDTFVWNVYRDPLSSPQRLDFERLDGGALG